MPFEPGTSGNPEGRKPGTPNKTTAEIRLLIQSFIENNLPKLQADFDMLDPQERLMFIERLLKYILPRNADSEYFPTEVECIVK